MGSWFSNLHIRKNGVMTEETVVKNLIEFMETRNYILSASKDDADGAIAITADEDCQWISVYSDLLIFEDPEKYTEIAAPLSAVLQTDVLGIACFDSDYLYLNLINAEDQTDAWIGIGSASGLGIKRRTGLTAWKSKVSNFQHFSESAKKEYIFAEGFLIEAESCLDLPANKSSACYEYLEDYNLEKTAKYLYFKLPDEMKPKEPVRLVFHTYSCMPCFLDQPSIVNAINTGEGSKGLSVYFLGPYVENDEITFSDVCFVKQKNHRMESIPFELTKIQLSNGQWAYYYHDPGFRIEPKVDDRLPISKRLNMSLERSIVVRFTPHGNPRKILDISVVLVPDKNPKGQTGWNAWSKWGSKKAFIEQYNQTWDQSRTTSPNPDACPPALRLEDFD